MRNSAIYDFNEIQKNIDKIREQERAGQVPGTEQGVNPTTPSPAKEDHSGYPGYYGSPCAFNNEDYAERYKPGNDRPWTAPGCY